MSRRHYNLPPFTTLCVFEAAARHLSFKNASQELGVTPGAVSHQIKALEGELGIALFERQNRGVALTKDGEALYETLASTFQQVSQRLTRLRRTGDDHAVTVGSTTAVAALWLSPAVIEFWREHPDVSVHQVTQDKPFESVQKLDFFVCYGRMQNSSLYQTPLFRDNLVAVAAPEQAAALQGCDLTTLASQRLIHLDAENPSWTRWAEWFEHLGHKGDIAQGTRVNSYSVALQIARKGAGIALGWRGLIQPMIEAGKLSTIAPYAVAAPHQFYLAGLPDTELSPGAMALKTWLLKSAKPASD